VCAYSLRMFNLQVDWSLQACLRACNLSAVMGTVCFRCASFLSIVQSGGLNVPDAFILFTVQSYLTRMLATGCDASLMNSGSLNILHQGSI
jgi:hypothetical protein